MIKLLKFRDIDSILKFVLLCVQHEAALFPQSDTFFFLNYTSSKIVLQTHTQCSKLYSVYFDV